MFYSQGKTKESWDIINNQDYTLTVKKTWVEPTNQWHIVFTSKLSDYPAGHTWECFLTHAEVQKLKDIL
jgi:hypothetical protein